MKSAGFWTPISWSFASTYFTISKWSALAPGHREQIRGAGRCITRTRLLGKMCLCLWLDSPAVNTRMPGYHSTAVAEWSWQSTGKAETKQPVWALKVHFGFWNLKKKKKRLHFLERGRSACRKGFLSFYHVNPSDPTQIVACWAWLLRSFMFTLKPKLVLLPSCRVGEWEVVQPGGTVAPTQTKYPWPWSNDNCGLF